MRRLLFVSTSTTIGGAEKTLYTLATLVDPQLAKVVGIVSLKPKGEYARRLEAAGHRVFCFDIGSPAGFREVQKLAVVIHEVRPDIVHAVMYQAIQLSRAVRWLGYADYKLVSSPRVNYRTRGGFSLFVDARLKSADDLLVTECEASRKYLIDKLGYPDAKTLTIHNGVEMAGLPVNRTERQRLRSELGLGERDILIGSVGRLDEQKGHVYLLEALAKLQAVRPARCVLIGDGPLRGTLQAMIQRLGLDEAVRIVGEVSDIPAWLSALDIFVLPSLWEGLPNALLEAMSIGLPVVASQVDGVLEVVAHNVSGLLCPAKDSQGLFVAIQDMMADPALRQNLGAGAKAVIATNFRLADMIQKYEAVYQRVLPAAAA